MTAVALSNVPCRGCGQLIAEAALVNRNGKPCTRCPSCEAVARGLQLAAEGMAATSAAHPDEKERILKVIAEVRLGAEVSANTIRDQIGCTGPIVGAAFRAAKDAGLIRHVRYERSSKASTHGHPIAIWMRVAA